MATRYQYAKDYLSQAIYIDQRINSKMIQLQSSREMTTRVTAQISGMPRSPNPLDLADFLAKAIDLENEIAADLEQLLATKAEITEIIKRVEGYENRTLLELRYLSFKKWDLIAIELYVNPRWVHRLHNRALEEVDAILRQRQ